MDVHGRLVALVAASSSPSAALTAVARMVNEEIRADSCSVFVRTRSALRLYAQAGDVSSAESSTAELQAATISARDLRDVTDARSDAIVLAVPVAGVGGSVGAILVRRRGAPPFAADDAGRLRRIAAQIAEVVDAAHFGEVFASDERPSYPPASAGEETLAGIAASSGIAMGVATFRSDFPRALVRRDDTHRGLHVERARVRQALEATRADLVHLQDEAAIEIGEEHALIFGAHLLLLNDAMLADLVEQGLNGGRSAAIAMEGAFDELLRRMGGLRDAYIRERVEDVEDVRTRVFGHLVGRPNEGAIDARVVVSKRMTPSLVVELKGRGALAIVSELGGTTSHGVLLARALGVPAVTGVLDLTHVVVAGDPLIVDGDTGRIVVRPTAATRAAIEHEQAKAARPPPRVVREPDGRARTADGTVYSLQANIALGADLAIATENRADGVGLYRTEFPFIVRDALPTIDEQVRIYQKAYAAFPTAPITFRLLDLAGDKMVAGRELGVSPDAFHGYRSIRILFDHPHLLRDQVQAFVLAANGRDLRILIPMVTSVEDVVRIKELIASAIACMPAPVTLGLFALGAMIETPAAAEIVTQLADEVDFFSIGTNDLVQYTLVVDRDDPRMASERHNYHPAVMRILRRITREAQAAGKHVTVCGEMASHAELALMLLALGVDALSVTPRAIPALERALALRAVEPLRASLGDLCNASTTADVERYVGRHASVVQRHG